MKSKYLNMYMEMAEAAAKTSVAERLKVGCCIVTESGMCAVGLNGTYPGYDTNCCEDLTQGELVTKPQTRHAEFAALSKMMAEGVSTKGATVFITHSPCHPCALLLIGAHVKRVFYKNFYKCDLGIEELLDADVSIEQLN